MPPNRIPRLLVFLLFITGLVIAAVQSRAGADRQAQRLPNGAILALEGVTYGPDNRLIRSHLGLRLLRPVLPTEVWRALGGRENTHSSNHPVVWLSRAGEVDGVPATVFDEHGCETSTSGIITTGTAPDPLIGYVLGAIPRCGRRIGLRVYDARKKAAAQLIAEFRLPLKLPPPASPWPAAPPPVVVREGDLTCELTRFVIGVERSDASSPERKAHPVNAVTRLTLKLRQDGRKVAGWRPVAAVAHGPDGDRYATGGSKTWRQGDVVVMQVPWNLLPNVPAWKLRIELARTAAAEFPPDELLTLPNVSIGPPSGALSMIYAGPERQVGEGRVTLMDLRWQSERKEGVDLFVALAGFEFPGTTVVVARAVDDLGREIPPSDEPPSVFGVFNTEGLKQAWLRLPLRVAPDARRVDLTLAVHPTRFVELTATPTRP